MVGSVPFPYRMNIDTAIDKARKRKRLPEPATRRSLRQDAGLSQAQIAAALGVSAPAVSRWESGRRDPSDAHLDAYAAVLKRLAEEAGL